MPGDANLDGQFDSTDLLQVFVAGQYEDQQSDNSTWETGDWTCDGEFSSSDLVAALQHGAYAAHAIVALTDAASALDDRFSEASLTQDDDESTVADQRLGKTRLRRQWRDDVTGVSG